MSERLNEIMKKNSELEKQSPYNFCDRWCEYCPEEKQRRCQVYQDEFEFKVSCIAHGKDEDDPEIFDAIMQKKQENLGDIEDKLEDLDTGFTEDDISDFEKTRQTKNFVENDLLQKTAEQYFKKTHELLKDTFYNSENNINKNLVFDFKIISWYHSLLPVKINRVLNGLNEASCGDDFSLYDAVAQMQVCKKAITRSTQALHNIKKYNSSYSKQIFQLTALLGNIQSRLLMMEKDI